MNGKEKYSRADYRMECKVEAIGVLAELEGYILRDAVELLGTTKGEDITTLVARAGNMRAVGTRVIMDPRLRAPTAIVQAVKLVVQDFAEKYPNGSGPLGSIVRVWCEISGNEADRLLATARHVCAEQADRRSRINSVA